MAVEERIARLQLAIEAEEGSMEIIDRLNAQLAAAGMALVKDSETAGERLIYAVKQLRELMRDMNAETRQAVMEAYSAAARGADPSSGIQKAVIESGGGSGLRDVQEAAALIDLIEGAVKLENEFGSSAAKSVAVLQEQVDATGDVKRGIDQKIKGEKTSAEINQRILEIFTKSALEHNKTVYRLGRLAKQGGEQGMIATKALEGALEQVHQRMNDIRESGVNNVGLMNEMADLTEKQDALQAQLNERMRAVGRIRLAANRGPTSPYNTLLQLSRVAQDMPWGLLGIANNLDMLIIDFIRMRDAVKASNMEIGVFRHLLTSMFKSPMGWMVILNMITSSLIASDKIAAAWDKVMEKVRGSSNWMKRLEEAAAKGSGEFWHMSESTAHAVAEIQNLIDVRKRLTKETRRAKSKLMIAAEEWRFWGGSSQEELKELTLAHRDLKNQLYSVTDAEKDSKEELEKLVAKMQAYITAGKQGTTMTSDLGREMRDKLLSVASDLAKEYDELNTVGPQGLASIDAEWEKEARNIVDMKNEWAGYLKYIKDRWPEAYVFAQEEIGAIIDYYEKLFGAKYDRVNQERTRSINEWTLKVLSTEDSLEKRRDEIAKSRAAKIKDDFNKELELLEVESAAKERTLYVELQQFLKREDVEQKHKVEAQKLYNEQLIEMYGEYLEKREDIEKKRQLSILDRQRRFSDIELRIEMEKQLKLEGFAKQRHDTTNEALKEEARIIGEIEKLKIEQKTGWEEEVAHLQKLMQLNYDLYRLKIEQINSEERLQNKQRTKSIVNEIKDIKFELEELNAYIISSAIELQLKLAEIAKARAKFALDTEKQERLAALRKIQDITQRVKEQILIEAWYNAEKKKIDKEYEASLVDAGKSQRDLLISQFTSAFSTLSGIAGDSYKIWENKRKAELAALGYSQSDASKIIASEGKKRLAIQKRFAQLEILIQGAVSAEHAFTSMMKSGLPAPFNVIAAYGFAAAVMAGAVQRARAVGSENPSGIFGGGSGGTGGNYGITERSGSKGIASRSRTYAMSATPSMPQTMVSFGGDVGISVAEAMKNSPIIVQIGDKSSGKIITVGERHNRANRR